MSNTTQVHSKMAGEFSARCQHNFNKEPSLLYDGLRKCQKNPYQPTDNQAGVINLGTSENLICDDLIIPKLESLTKITPPELRYFPLNGMWEFRVELARFLTDKSKSDQVIDPEDISVTNGCSSAFSSLAYMIGDPGDHFLINTPYYGMTSVYMGNYMGLKPIEVDTDSENMVCVKLLEEAWDKAQVEGKTVRGVVLINPNNPTGAVYSKERVLQVTAYCKWVVLRFSNFQNTADT